MKLVLLALSKALCTLLAMAAVFALFILFYWGLNWLLGVSVWLLLGLGFLIIVSSLTYSYYDELK